MNDHASSGVRDRPPATGDHDAKRARSRVVVAMSGGVDSSVAAALLVEQGYDVVGVMMRLWAEEALPDAACLPDNGRAGFVHNRCCTPDSVEDARKVCVQLGIPFYLVNAERSFRHRVVDPFVAAYASGHTPNPCLACNRHIRFGYLWRYAAALGARFVATGHYARVRKNGDTFQLLTGIDSEKDQSYVLYTLGQDDLPHVLFPVGDKTKPLVRKMARDWGLPVSEKAESQDLCFVAGGSYRQLLRRRVPDALTPGPILDLSGRRLGTHRGLPLYTVGQRRGLGVIAGEPLYVLELRRGDNALVVGPAEALGHREVDLEAVHFVSGCLPAGPVQVAAKVRYNSPGAPATLIRRNGGARLVFDRPQRAVAPGQGAVFYQDDVLVGGGLICGVGDRS